MKIKYLLGAALCCALLVACQTNDPDKNTGNDNKTNNEVIEGLNDLVDGIGNIVDTKTLENGSIVKTDDKGNTITKDKEGNITIVTKEGETILIDNSIKEDSSAAKDKWYNSTWKSSAVNTPQEGQPDMNYRKKQFVENLRELGFVIEEVNVNKDSTEINIDDSNDYTIHFRNTTTSLQKVSTSTQYTYNGTYHLIRYDVKQKEIGEGETRYRFEISKNEWDHFEANLYEDLYEYNNDLETYMRMDSRQIDGVGLENDDAIYSYEGYDIKSTKEDVLSKDINTTYFNYRRLSDTQIAASNSSISYIINERTDQGTPKLEVNDLQGNKLISLELVSL